jgi:cytochrome c oxidase cbb3-type subunit 2
MPSYSWLARTPLDAAHIEDDLRVQRLLGVPYSEEMVTAAASDLSTQGSADPADAEGLLARYQNANIRDFTGAGGLAGRLSEADALIAYLQSLGTFVDFSLYDDKANIR